MPTRAIKVWNQSASAWENVGIEAPAGGGRTVSYQAASPSSPTVGQIWVESDVDLTSFDLNQYLTQASASATYLREDTASATYLTISTAATNYSPLNISEVEKTTNFELELTDANKLLRVNSASAVSVTVPINASVSFSTGTTVLLYQAGAGAVTISGAAGVTINSLNSASAITGQYGQASLIKRGTDEWLLAGNIQ